MREVLIGDGAQRQAREIHLVRAAEMEQQVQGADERLDPDGDAGVGGLTLGGRPLGGCFLPAHLFIQCGGPEMAPALPQRRTTPRVVPTLLWPRTLRLLHGSSLMASRTSVMVATAIFRARLLPSWRISTISAGLST